VIAPTTVSQHEYGTCGGTCSGVIWPRTPHGADRHHKSAAQRQDVPTQSAKGGAGTPRTATHSTGEVSATDEAAKAQTDPVIRDSLSKVLEQYNKLSEIPPSAVGSDKASPPRQLSRFRRVFRLYRPRTISGWIVSTLVYIGISYVVVLVLAFVAGMVSGLVAGLFS
jgi:hypothetical protein